MHPDDQEFINMLKAMQDDEPASTATIFKALRRQSREKARAAQPKEPTPHRHLEL